VHHLRELAAAAEHGHTWPLAMSCLLLDTKDAVQQARATGTDQLDRDALDELETSFQTIIALGHKQHPPRGTGKRT